MKKYFGFLVLFVGLATQALPAGPPTSPKQYDLLKCTSPKNGTIWASFGHAILAGEANVRYFPTEIVLFAPDISSRWVWKSLEEALKMDVNANIGRIHMGFTVPTKDGSQQTHLIQIRVYDARLPNSFLGNWKVTEAGKEERNDLISCTVN